MMNELSCRGCEIQTEIGWINKIEQSGTMANAAQAAPESGLFLLLASTHRLRADYMHSACSLLADYLRRRRIIGTSPKSPVPSRAIELGSGTVDVPTVKP